MSSDSWSPPTPTTRTPTMAPSARPSDLASGMLPVPGTGPATTPHWTADWVSTMQQMQLTLATLERRLAALETRHVVAATRIADKHSNAPVAHRSACPGRPKPSESSQTPTMPPSRNSRWASCSTSNTPLTIPLAQDLPPTNGKTPCYKCTLKLPDSLVAHVIRHQGCGLKQAHDLSGSWLAAFSVGPADGEGRRFVFIQGTDQQIGEALVVLGKCIAKKRVCALRKQQSGNAALAPSREPASSTPKPSIQFAPPPPKASAQSALPPPPMASMHDSTTDFKEPADWDDLLPMPVPAASLLPAGSPMALSTPTPALSSPMVIDYAFGHYAPGTSTAPPCSTNTA
ncbi:hypothetical protein C0993_002777 [Termitomyces sp. T159_Od127]|nr:hypothetical protein C0993_002777 [Termitomyces sp. T159_Od127]